LFLTGSGDGFFVEIPALAFPMVLDEVRDRFPEAPVRPMTSLGLPVFFIPFTIPFDDVEISGAAG